MKRIFIIILIYFSLILNVNADDLKSDLNLKLKKINLKLKQLDENPSLFKYAEGMKYALNKNKQVILSELNKKED